MSALLLAMLEERLGLDEATARKAVAVVLHWDGKIRGAGQMDDLFGLCQSPMERRFLFAATSSGLKLEHLDVEATTLVCTLIDRPELVLRIRPQATPDGVGRPIRLDFEITVNRGTIVSGPLCVEIDGHDFHERTKEQATRDKSRDRMLGLAGYTVFRFTGSEVFADARRCWADIVQFAIRWAASLPQETANGATSGPMSSSGSNEGSGHE